MANEKEFKRNKLYSDAARLNEEVRAPKQDVGLIGLKKIDETLQPLEFIANYFLLRLDVHIKLFSIHLYNSRFLLPRKMRLRIIGR